MTYRAVHSVSEGDKKLTRPFYLGPDFVVYPLALLRGQAIFQK